MSRLQSDIEGSLQTSPNPTFVIAIVLFLAMVGVVGYLAWKNRKKVIAEQRRAEEQK